MDNARILIVEDDVNIAIYLKAALISMGYQVIGLAASGEEPSQPRNWTGQMPS
jgi:DNA-binding response OmpR family regulator